MIFKAILKRGTNKRIISLVLCLIVAVSAISFDVFAKSKSELEADIEKYDKQIEEAEGKLNELKAEKEKQEEYLEALEEQINVMKAKDAVIQTQINAIDEEIAELRNKLRQLKSEISIIEEDIATAEKKITDIENNIKESSDLLARRLRTAYMQGEDSDLKILMGADSLASFLTRLEMMKRTSEKDKQIIVEFRDKVIELEEQKAVLVESKNERDIKKAELDIKKEEAIEKKSELKAKQKEQDEARKKLEINYAEIEELVSEIDKSSVGYQSYISKLEADKKAADAEIDKILQDYYATSNQQTTTLASGGNVNPTTKPDTAGDGYNSNASWAWPLGNASCYISSNFGYRNPNISGWGFHGGTDITGGGIEGKPVYATRAGKVITAVTSYDPRGYGIYVMIDHGDGYSSLYAHMSARYVNTGDTVSKGQMIGRVGDTGNSRGAHLHFEVRYYGEKKDPMNYVKKPG